MYVRVDLRFMRENIRNFVIIAHIDHGKSTLADRMLEITGTIEARLMKPQFLDQLELERERGITIKMAPVRMTYGGCILNLIDTPGHSDFGYEVSRALTAVEGAVLLLDATQGIQAQTVANYESAKRAGLLVIGAVNKIDVAEPEQIEESIKELAALLQVSENDIMKVSGKTGEGVKELLITLVRRVPAPSSARASLSGQVRHNSEGRIGYSRALVFDSFYDEHKGVLAFVRVFDGSFEANGDAMLMATRTTFKMKEVGVFKPARAATGHLGEGEIGYIATGIKDPDKLKIGDTITDAKNANDAKNVALPGYQEPNPVVFVSFYPEDPSEYDNLRQALGYLRLNDASLHFESDMSEILGRGFKGGFLGRLHFEITADRLAREFNVQTVHSFPSVAYQIKLHNNGWMIVTNPKDFPADAAEILEPMVKAEILTKPQYLGSILGLKEIFRFFDVEVDTLAHKARIRLKLPLADLVSDLDDKLKSMSEGFASLSYEPIGWERADVVKMEILVANHEVPGLTRIIPRNDVEREGRRTVERLKELLPREQFVQAVQAVAAGRIIARETIPAMRKDVTGYLYGGDRTRKMKLWKKQQKGKKRLKEIAEKSQVKIPASIFKELLKR